MADRIRGDSTRLIASGAVSTAPIGQTVQMGPLLIVITLLVVIPVAVIITGGVISVLLGHSLRKEGEYRNEGSEFTGLNH